MLLKFSKICLFLGCLTKSASTWIVCLSGVETKGRAGWKSDYLFLFLDFLKKDILGFLTVPWLAILAA